MAKSKTIFVCSSCGADFPKWMGKCPSCGEWSTIKEQTVQAESHVSAPRTIAGLVSPTSRPVRLSEVSTSQECRIQTGCVELDRVLGGGIVPGSVTLLGGEPGIGKSTLVLQTVLRMKDRKILYVSGEESVQQLKLRANRIDGENENAWFVSETSLEKVFEHISNVRPELLIVDSIQTMYTEMAESSAGSVSQVRECAASLLRLAKTQNLPVILIGHINKEGSIAGPKVLEHIVDTVLLFEGDSHHVYRVLRSVKNRFGSIDEIGMYEMRREGLREVSNPSELLLTQQHLGLSGVSIAAAIEGIRPFMIEVQALVSTAAYGMAQRSPTGFDVRRLNMLLAVLEKRVGFKLAQKDVFLNIAGGIKVSDPAIDLAVIASVLSSNLDMPVDKKCCLAGEVGLAGEIRPVNRLEQRIAEAQKLGFERIIIPKFSGAKIDFSRFSIKVEQVQKVDEAFKTVFG